MDKNILLIHQIPEKIIEIIKNSSDFCFLVTPYFKPWTILEREFEKAAKNNKKIIFIFRDENDSINRFSYLNDDYDFDLIFVERLHAKLYLNEKEALLTSMNLYESSKDNNYEIGYYLQGIATAKNLKKQVIEDDILQGNHYILKGRYFRELEEKENTEQQRKEQQELKKEELRQQKIKEGFCIRCGTKIRFDRERPFCYECFQIWNTFQNPNYPERFCHECGRKNGDFFNITFSKPICEECFRRGARF